MLCRERGAFRMKIITVTNQKGGTGKTSTSNALMAGLSKKGYKVLAVDLDPQCNLSLILEARQADSLRSFNR